MTPAKQIDAIQKMARRGVAVWLSRGLAVMAIGLFVGGLYTGHPIYYLLSVFSLVVAYSARQTTPHILNAAKALESGSSVKGTIHIEVTQWSDSPVYHATVQVPPSRKWRFEFIPLGWSPTEGNHEARLFCIQDVDWPALVQVEKGVLYPRQKPRLQERDADD